MGSAIAQTNQTVKNYFSKCNGYNCDNAFNVKGTMAVASGATVTGLLTDVSNATGKVASGVLTLDGSNPSSAATGLTSAVNCVVTEFGAPTPGTDPVIFTVSTTAGNGQLDVYAWKFTNSSTTTLIASTNSAAQVEWICKGS
jgi:hypothetical protein